MLQMLHFIGSLAARGRVKCSGTQHERRAQVLKKLALVIAALAVSAPALADHRYRDHYRGHRQVVQHYHVKHHYYRPAPRPAVVHHVYHRPAPRPLYVVQHHNHVNPVAVLAGAVILGGIRSIGRFTGFFVPMMILVYIVGSLVVLAINWRGIPGIFIYVIQDAFSPAAPVGGAGEFEPGGQEAGRLGALAGSDEYEHSHTLSCGRSRPPVGTGTKNRRGNCGCPTKG
jgi:hypothetical protein